MRQKMAPARSVFSAARIADNADCAASPRGVREAKVSLEVNKFALARVCGVRCDCGRP
jgi:hypothetical protein